MSVQQQIALIKGRLIDGTGCEPVEPATLIVEGSHLQTVGYEKDVVIPKRCKIFDLKGKTVMPALIDGHMHVTREPGRLDHMGHVKTNLQGIGTLQATLQWGTGTVAHAAGSPESIILRDVIKEGTVKWCSDMLIGGVVTATCGHLRGHRNADGPWEIRSAVREMIAAGADHIKTCASGGFMYDHEKLTHEDYTYEELEALVEIAHSRDKRVHVHAHAQPGLNNAIKAGCDVILHGALIDDEALEGIAAKDLWYMPTLHITSEKVWGVGHLPEFMVDRMKAAHPIHCNGVAKACKMGIKLAAGTDGGSGSVMNELRLLVDCGLSEMQAIVVATKNTADALGILDRVGTLEAGKIADILVVNDDPIKDIKVLSSRDTIFMVMKAGVIQMTGNFDPNIEC